MNSSLRGAAALAFALCLVIPGSAEAQLFQRARSTSPYVRAESGNQATATIKKVKRAQDSSDSAEENVSYALATDPETETESASALQASFNSYNTFENSSGDSMEMIPSGEPSYSIDGSPCDSCFSDCCSTGCLDCCGPPKSICCRPGQFFFGAEYIYARASFSEALAYVITDSAQPLEGNNFVEFDFNYESSYRFYGGYRLCDCDAEIVFNYARYRSDASFSVAGGGTLVDIVSPYEIDPTSNGLLTGNANVDLDSYDLGVARTIRLGCPLGCCLPCCDTCCGDTCCDDTCCEDTCCGDSCCGNWCPAWDITWSAGVRFADADWNRGTTAFDDSLERIDSSITTLSFDGVGARIGLLGRRYFGCRGCVSAYARGDISLLVGNMDIQTVLPAPTGSSVPLDTISHRNSGRRVIPVTEIEAGLEAHIGRHLHLSSGYFISAWHDLGMRDEYGFDFMLSHYDDANILGFDGLFARAEITF